MAGVEENLDGEDQILVLVSVGVGASLLKLSLQRPFPVKRPSLPEVVDLILVDFVVAYIPPLPLL